MRITIIGHGYVGLVTACVFADFGNEITVIGHTKEKIDRLKQGDPIIYEPGLKELLEKNLKAKRLNFVLDYSSVKTSEIVFIAVGTPPKNNGEADLSTVFTVAKKIGQNLSNKKNHFTVVSCKSTVPVGTNKIIEKILKENAPQDAEFSVASCPEFLREGTAIYDTLNPDRVVIGSESNKANEILLKLHQPINTKKVVTDLTSAELIKYVSNAMLATKISFANLISFYAEKVGADVEAVLDAVGLDQRIGRIFMNPGIGYGGSCLPKDVMALIDVGKKLGIDTGFLEEIEKINLLTRKNFLKKVVNNTNGKNLAIWGLAFKPYTDDIRFAPSIFIIENLLKKGYKIDVYDPAAMENIKKIFDKKLTYHNNLYQCIIGKEALLILTEWNEFKQVDLNKVRKLLKKPVIFDGRNIYNPQLMKNFGFNYYSIGRPVV